MKNGLNIFCNNDIKNFLPSLLSDYELTIMKLDLIKDNIQASQPNIIIINNATFRKHNIQSFAQTKG